MASRIEKNEDKRELVISGFEKGIADSPETGFGDIRSINLTSIPGEISAGFGTEAATLPPIGISGVAFTTNGSTDVITVASTSGYYAGMAIQIQTSTPSQAVSYLAVGGGGAGGVGNASSGGGGGGAGEVKTGSVAVTPQVYTITVGAGGTGNTGAAGGTGANTTALGITSTGGGGGAGTGAPTSGGSGGGGNNGQAGAAASGNGSAGGTGANPGGAGGGGGASAVGQSVVGSNNGGNGGNGISNSISGSSVTYGGGGGGGERIGGVVGNGGTGGGGAGGSVAGSANTGGGGGGGTGAGGVAGGNGGTGLVIISYPTGSLTAIGGVITTSGGNTIHTFNSTGSFTVSGSPAAGIYYIGNLTPTTFKIYDDTRLTSLVNIIGNGTGTYNIPSYGTPVWSTTTNLNSSSQTFIIDSTGNVWYLYQEATTNVAVNTLQYTANIGHSTTSTGLDVGICVWQGYLFAIIGTHIDYVAVADLISNSLTPGWVYGWKTNLSSTSTQHYAIPAADDAMYICNADSIASILNNAGTAFDPTSSGTYTYNTDAILLPNFDSATHMAQLGVLLLVGGIQNFVYPCDRNIGGFTYPLICADTYIHRIVSTNSNAYVFAGSRGRIYICNGQQIQLYKKIPDSLSGNPEPYYAWGDALYFRNKLHFTFSAFTNAGVALNSTGGIWALGIDAGQTQIAIPTAGSLFGEMQFSYGTYGGSCTVLFVNLLALAPGYGVGGAWVNSSTVGVDVGSSNPYANYQTYADTDLIWVGDYFNPITFIKVQYKVSKPLVAGESIRVSYRTNLSDNFVVIWTSTATGKISDYKQPNFQKAEWIQFRIELSSTPTNPSYVRLTELRITL